MQSTHMSRIDKSHLGYGGRADPLNKLLGPTISSRSQMTPSHPLTLGTRLGTSLSHGPPWYYG